MKYTLASIPLIALLAAAASSGALAHEESSNYGPYHWFSHVQEGSADPPARMAGTFDPAQYAEGASLYLVHAQIAAMGSLQGMAGPLRTDSEMAATEREWDKRLGSVNGRNTP